MYAYKSAANLLADLSETSFQVSADSYQVFRNAVYYQYMMSNDDYVQGLATAGRKPEARTNTFSQYSLKTLANAGGKILGLSTADPIFSGLYNRLHGVEPSFNYNTVTPFETGFFQFNHASASAFRKDDWVVFKGYSDHYDGKLLQVNRITYSNFTSFLYINNNNSDNGESSKARLATYDEMFKAGIDMPFMDRYEIY